MTLHPKEPRRPHRRDFLLRAGRRRARPLERRVAARGLLEQHHDRRRAARQPASPSAPAACRSRGPTGRSRCRCGRTRSRSGLKPETGGTFTIFNYPNYLYTKLLKEFCKKYDVTPQYTAVRQHRLGHPAAGRRARCSPT